MKPHAKCKHCGQFVNQEHLVKAWNCTPNAKAGEITVIIYLWKCPSCKKTFRTADRIWPHEKGKLQKLKDLLK